MKTQLIELLICPACLPGEYELHAQIDTEVAGDIYSGSLKCSHCHSVFPIEDGVANLDPNFDQHTNENKYEYDEVVSSYLWSHYGDLLDDEMASEAYQHWSNQILPHKGTALDTGGAVGRFTFELGNKCDFAIGIDNSAAFIKTARKLMQKKKMTVSLKEEGFLSRTVEISLPDEWRTHNVEFIIADAQKLPFRSDSISMFASLNLVDKVPAPMIHLEEMNRVTHSSEAQFLLSDPFSWSTEASEVDNWLGGQDEGPFAGKGIDNISNLLRDGDNGLGPAWQVEEPGHVWWKIRTHSNHYELIKSCFIKASR